MHAPLRNGAVAFVAMTVVSVLSGSVSAAASECIEYADYIHWSGSIWIPGRTSNRAAVSGGHAFIAAWDEGLQIVDIDDPGAPRVVGSVDTPGTARGVAVSGSYAYVADGDSLLVIDIEDHGSPVIVGAVDLVAATHVVVSGSHTYVADGIRIAVVDVSDPTTPYVAGGVNVGGTVMDVALSGTRAYAAVSFLGLRVVDISNPLEPSVVGGVDTPGDPRAVALSPGRAYLAVGMQTPLQVIDLADPDHPSLLEGIAAATSIDVAVLEEHLYVASFGAGLRVVDIADSLDPFRVTSIEASGDAVGVTLGDGHVYVSSALGNSANYLHVVDIANPQPPRVLGEMALPDWAGGMAVSGNHVYVANGSAGLQVVDVSDAANPGIVGGVNTPAANDVVIADTRAYVADGSVGLQMMDISVPGSPTLLGGVAIPDVAGSVFVSDVYALVTAHWSGLQIVDVSDPSAPEIVGAVATPSAALCVAASGDYAFVGDNVGLRVIDIRDPRNPHIVGNVDTPNPVSPARSVVVSGHHVYVGGNSNFVVIDVMDPENPEVVANTELPGPPVDIALHGTNAFVACGSSGLSVVDIADPEAPLLIGGVMTGVGAAGVAVFGAHACVSAGMGLKFLPAQCNELTPVVLSSFTATWRSGGVVLEWSTTSETDHLGFHVYRQARSSGWARMTGELLRTGPQYSFLDREAIPGHRNEYVIESVGRRGETERFGPLGIDVPVGARLPLHVSPNPSPGPAAIGFALTDAETIAIRVFDLSGRLVRVVSRGDYETGIHRVEWNGMDDGGRPVPSGVYFVTLQSHSGERVVRLNIVK